MIKKFFTNCISILILFVFMSLGSSMRVYSADVPPVADKVNPASSKNTKVPVPKNTKGVASTSKSTKGAASTSKSTKGAAPTPSGVKVAPAKVGLADENLDSYKGYQKPMGAVLDIRSETRGDGGYNLIFRVNRVFLAEVKILNFPFRLLVDIPMPYQWKVDNKTLARKIPYTVVSSFRYGNPVENVFRIVADLGRPVSVNKAYVNKVNNNLYDFVIELGSDNKNSSVLSSNTIVYANDKEVLKEISQIADKRAEEKRFNQRRSRISERIKDYLGSVTYPVPSNTYSNRKVIVMVDPGHGGKDPGAVVDNLKEKEIVLTVAKKLKEQLEKNPEISAILTRSGDYYVPLKDRVLWAEYLGADVFVSLHADKSETNNISSGMSVYTLSDEASDVQAQILANNSNKSDTIAGITLSKEDEDVNLILNQLSQRAKSNESGVLSRSIISVSSQNIKILSNPIRSAGFAVLKVPNIPSILIELGFLSNNTDIANFKKEDHLNKLSASVSAGVQSYLWSRGMLKILPKAVIASEKKGSIEEENTPKTPVKTASMAGIIVGKGEDVKADLQKKPSEQEIQAVQPARTTKTDISSKVDFRDESINKVALNY